jgi:hypothetical protein
VTAAADDQLRLIGVVTLAILVLAALIGLGVGRRITSPIMLAVSRLRKSSEALKGLADKEQGAATQQSWVVDSSQVGLRTVQYYTNASTIALQRLNAVGKQLLEYWSSADEQTVKKTVELMVKDASYVETAITYQQASNQKLESTIKVTVQVAEQLVEGATSATDAAEQLEQVVGQLQEVIGK